MQERGARRRATASAGSPSPDHDQVLFHEGGIDGPDPLLRSDERTQRTGGALDDGHVAAIIQVDAVNQGAQAATGAYDILTKQGGRLAKVVVMRPKLLTKDNLKSATSWSQQLAKIKGGSLTR